MLCSGSDYNDDIKLGGGGGGGGGWGEGVCGGSGGGVWGGGGGLGGSSYRGHSPLSKESLSCSLKLDNTFLWGGATYPQNISYFDALQWGSRDHSGYGLSQ